MAFGIKNPKEEAVAALAEFFATLFFVYFGAGSVCAAVQAQEGLFDIKYVQPINYATAFGFSITILAFAV